jgi:nitrite reductase (NADH) small subunit
VAGDTVTCPLHAWQIALDSGQACAPDMGCARRFDVDVRDGTVWICLAAASDIQAAAAEALA